MYVLDGTVAYGLLQFSYAWLRKVPHLAHLISLISAVASHLFLDQCSCFRIALNTQYSTNLCNNPQRPAATPANVHGLKHPLGLQGVAVWQGVCGERSCELCLVLVCV